MNGYIVLAAILLTMPPNSGDYYESCHDIELLEAIIDVAVQWEVVDGGNDYRDYLLRVAKDDVKCFLTNLQNKWRNVRDAPPLIDERRFPSNEVLDEWMAFNKSFEEYLQTQLKLCSSWQRDFWMAAIQDNQTIWSIFDAIKDSRSKSYYIDYRRDRLRKVRNLIGYENYYNGVYPPCVPLWALKRID